MAKIRLQKMDINGNSVFAPCTPESIEMAKTIPIGKEIDIEYSFPRNTQFHRKWFALLKIGYDNWAPGEINSQYGTPEKNFERFRKDVTILAGYYHIVVRLDGTTRVEADSVSFGNMDEAQFSELYSKTIDVLLKRVYNSSMSAEQLDELVDKFMGFV